MQENAARLWRTVLSGWLAALLLATGALATPVREAPWRAEAAAYRATLFLLNLDPVDWTGLAAVWNRPYPGAFPDQPASHLLPPDAAAALAVALQAQEPQALHRAASRGLVAAIEAHLAKAEAGLEAGTAGPPLSEARELYRAFADGIAAGDPANARRLGLAWLDLATAAGGRGLLGAGGVAPDAAAFARARAEIAEYLTTEYAPAAFAPGRRFLPLPESAPDAAMPAFLPPGSLIGDQTPLPRLFLRFETAGIDEETLPLVAYGDMLFDSPVIFGGAARDLGIACATCHNRGDVNRDFFIPGLSHRPGQLDVDSAFFNPLFNDRRFDPVDIPSLRGLRFTGPYGRDGRLASLREFTRNVIVTEFAGAEPTEFMLDALIAYMSEFDFAPNARLGPEGKLAGDASDAERRGEALFRQPFAGMDGAACATCHIPSARFLDRRAHAIGSGIGYPGDLSGAFDTPTLLGAAFTAPYFHDGSLPDLAAVAVWKNDRFGLALEAGDLADLTAYLEAVGAADTPYEAFDAENTRFRLAFGELTTFASTLDMLLPRRDAHHALLMIDTVAADLAGDASGMENAEARPEVYELAETLARAGIAIRADDWAAAEAEWAAFKALRVKIDAGMF